MTAAALAGRPFRLKSLARGLTLMELMIALAVVAILMGVALPSYTEHVKRSSRSAAQAQLVDLAALQERIFLNGNAYTNSVTRAYDGSASGGLGVTTGRTRDGRYELTASVSGASFTLTATPVTGGPQAGDGVITLNSEGVRRWGTQPW